MRTALGRTFFRRMMSLLLALTLILSLMPALRIQAAGSVTINSTNFPDANFRQYIKDYLDEDGDGVLSSAEIEATEVINVSEMDVSSLKGIEYFTTLRALGCDSNNLSSLDVSKNAALEILSCEKNNLTSLNISSNLKMRMVSLNYNQVTKLDITKNTALELLYLYGNKVNSLNVSKNTALQYLDCGGNGLTTIDVSKNTELLGLYCEVNQLTKLDVSKNTKLESLTCYYNQLTSLDVSHNPQLKHLLIDNNKISTIDLTNNPLLQWYECEFNPLRSIDISFCPILVDLFMNGNCNTESYYLNNEPFYAYTNDDENKYFGVDVGRAVSYFPRIILSSSSNGISLKWSEIMNATSYEISRETTEGTRSVIITTDATTYLDSNVKMGTEYFYWMRAYVNGEWTEYTEAAKTVFNPFKDVSTSSSYFNALCWAYNNGIVNGKTSTSFAPNNNCTRAQFAAMLWKLRGKQPASLLSNPFTDVEESSTFRNPIVWCYHNGIVAGTSPTTFNPNKNISRWQIMAMLWRMVGKPQSKLTTNPFTDVQITDAYYKAALWAYEKGITSVSTFKPNDKCTRWQLVVFLYKVNKIYRFIG